MLGFFFMVVMPWSDVMMTLEGAQPKLCLPMASNRYPMVLSIC